jgi:hypothetical protein
MSLEDLEEIVRVPLELNGTSIGFSTRTPSHEELDGCQHLHLSSQHEWDPGNLTVLVQRFELSALSTTSETSDTYETDASPIIEKHLDIPELAIRSHRVIEKINSSMIRSRLGFGETSAKYTSVQYSTVRTVRLQERPYASE